jgi:uncharacterized protein YjdB
MKKILCFLLCLTFIFTLSPMSLFAGPGDSGGSGGDDDYYKAVSAMVQSHWSDDYFARATLYLGDSVIKIDNRTVMLSNEVSFAGDELMIPEDALEVLGVEVEKNTLGARAHKNGKLIEITYGEKRMWSNSKQKDLDTAPQLENGIPMIPVSILREDGLGFELDYDPFSGKLTITDDFQTMRILAKTCTGLPLPAGIRAEKTITGPEGLYVLQFGTVDEAKAACRMLNASSAVVYAEPDCIVSLDEAANAGQNLPAANSYSHLSWGAERMGADAFLDYLSINGKLDTSVTVAVLDTGLDMTHPYFSNRYISGYNMVAGNTDPLDDHYHGTHVSGTVIDVTIAAPNVKIMPVKVLNSEGKGTDIQVASGIRWAAENMPPNSAKVINLSLGGFGDNITEKNAIAFATEGKNITVVVAAGNEADDTAFYSPAGYEEVITVAAIDEYDKPAPFTNFGNSVDVAAAGVDIVSANLGGGTRTLKGTSMSSPHAAGAAALLLCYDPDLSPKAVRALIRAGADVWQVSGNSTYYGAGILNVGRIAGKMSGQLISATPGSLTLDVGAGARQKQLTVGYYDNGAFTDITAQAAYLSSNAAVASVSLAGAVTIHKEGKANITVSYNGNITTVPVTGIVPQKVYLSKSGLTLAVSQRFGLYAEAQYSDGLIRAAEVTWTSSDESIAKVDDGYVTGVSPGSAQITATALNGMQASCTVTVAELVGLSLSAKTLSLKRSEVKGLSVLGHFADGNSLDVYATWETSNPSVARVSSSGTVTGVAPGVATITASIEEKTASCEVTVTELTGFSLNKSTVSVFAGTKDILNPTIIIPVTWSSSNPAVAVARLSFIPPSADLFALAPGAAIITATAANGVTATCTVNVKELVSISLSDEAVSLQEWDFIVLSVTGKGSDGSSEKISSSDVSWKSSNPAVAAVESGSTVRAKAPGVTTITATVNGKSATCLVTVTELTDFEISYGNPKEIAVGSREYIRVWPPVPVTWTCSNEAVATIKPQYEDTAYITGVSPGSVTVTATATGGKTATCTVNVRQLINISIYPTTMSLKEGESDYIFSIMGMTSHGTIMIEPRDVECISSDPMIAAVEHIDGAFYGRIMGVSPGTATITVTFAGKTATCKVTVTEAEEFPDITVRPETFSLWAGGDWISFFVQPSVPVTWEISDPSLVTVSPVNESIIRVTAVSPGITTITATSDYGKTSSGILTVLEMESMQLSKQTLSLQPGEHNSFIVHGKAPDGTSKTLSPSDCVWSSSNPLVASVSDSSLVRAISGGTTTITATFAGKSATCLVTVYGPAPTSIAVLPETIALDAGASRQLAANILPATANQTVSWTSSDQSVAMVDNKGLIAAKSAGTATITAEAVNGLKATCEVTVGNQPLYIYEANGAIGTIGRVLFEIPSDSIFLDKGTLDYEGDDLFDDFLKNYALVCDEDIDIEIYFSPKRTENAIAAGQNIYVFAVRLPNGETKEDISFSFKPIGGEIEKNKIIIYGDVNEDGSITTTDATLVTRWAGGNPATVLRNILAADVNGDAYITTTDATLITRRAGGNPVVFSVETRF